MQKNINQYKILKQKLFDGDERVLQESSFVLRPAANKEITVQVSDFENNKFEDLPSVIGSETFQELLAEGDFKGGSGFILVYKGSDDLRLRYCIKENFLFVFAYGEFQPARYKLYIEGIWEIKNLLLDMHKPYQYR